MCSCPNQSATLKFDKHNASHMRGNTQSKENWGNTVYSDLSKKEKKSDACLIETKNCRSDTSEHELLMLYILCSHLYFLGLHVCLSSVEYDFRQQERRFLEVLNQSSSGNNAVPMHLSQPLNFSLLRNVIKNLTKSKVKSKKLCKTLFKWLPRKIQQV